MPRANFGFGGGALLVSTAVAKMWLKAAYSYFERYSREVKRNGRVAGAEAAVHAEIHFLLNVILYSQRP